MCGLLEEAVLVDWNFKTKLENGVLCVTLGLANVLVRWRADN